MKVFYGVPFWIENGNAVLVYSEYDIWKLDMTGNRAPICITKKLGERTKTMLRLAISGERDLPQVPDLRLAPTDRLILLGQDFLTKDQKIYNFNIDKDEAPEELISGPFFLFRNIDMLPHVMSNDISHGIAKARNADVYVYIRSDLPTGSNVYLTKGSDTRAITNNRPPYEKYNGVTAELVSWEFSGEPRHGVLYKPENFDPSKKYPVIVTYYEKESATLNAPVYSENGQWFPFEANLSYYVSNGYVVFMPDIYYKIGDLRNSVSNSIISGVKELLKRSWVDARHIGATGTSFGGVATMCAVTKSEKLFAAALAEVGLNDMFYCYFNNPDFCVNGQMRMGVTLFERPDLYIQNSSSFFAKDIQTPLCVMNNNKDAISPLQYGMEMFTALRSFDKPVWWLQYKNQGHGVGFYYSNPNDPDLKDYRRRNQQFWDHFLKGATAPTWISGENQN